jgi:hypothetical protein
MRNIQYFTVLCLAPALARAQSPVAAPTSPPPDAEQITAAVQALPAEYRATAKVLGYHTGNKALVTLREGTGFICLANNPEGKAFHVACYHQSLEPFMARGRALRAQGVKDEQVDTVRFAEVKSGKLAMPKQPAALYQLFGGTFDPKTGTVTGAHPLFVAYISGATAATTGITEKPQDGAPWIMYPGTPKAHIMLTPKM